MKELINIEQKEFNNKIQNTVNARLLWKELESKQDFSNWIKNRLDGFIENIDFIRFNKKMEANNATLIEYFLTIETAKNIAMLERNEKGRRVREYFIKMEELAKQQNPFLTASRKDLLKLALEQEEKIEALQIESNQKQEIIDEFIAINDNKNYTEVAKLLHIPPRTFINKLKTLKYIKDNREPYQKYIDKNYFVIKYKKTHSYIMDKQIVKVIEVDDKAYPSYLITENGFRYFSKKFLCELPN